MFVKIQDGAVATYPYSVGQLRRDNPNVSFPKSISTETLESYGVYSVVEADAPSYDNTTQRIQISNQPELVNGVWTLTKSVVALTAEQIEALEKNKAGANRKKRDALLAETDWWALSDVTMTSAQSSYRQALRDITTHANWPHLSDNDWPTKP